VNEAARTSMAAASIAAVIVVGLALDQAVVYWGQAITNLAVWGLFLHWLAHARSEEQVILTSCIVYATLGEIFLSLVWGLYAYRLDNIPLFVPPGHVLLFILGSEIAPHQGPRKVASVSPLRHLWCGWQ
jgi:hypothetical protein